MRHLLRIHEGRVLPDFEHPGGAAPLAGIEGDRAAWMDALGPLADASRLRLSGEEALARRILAAIPGPPVESAER